MDSINPSKPLLRFAAFVCFWNSPHRSGESTRQRFFSIYFSIYEDLRQTLQQHSSGSNIPGRKWNMVRIYLPGKRFLGLVRR